VTWRIVLIDDSEIVLRVLGRAMSDAGFDVRAVSSLRDFVPLVMEWKPHLIVTDLYMPDLSGAELCTWLRGKVQTARTPIVICSGAPDAELRRVVKEVGADGFVSKSEGSAGLGAKLKELCEEIVW
jgi:CheY-like chemotaxis protein